jgi:hypothetical protein
MERERANEEEERKRREKEERRERELRERAQLTVTLKPDKVPIKHGLVMLGHMSRSRFYELAAAGVFDIYKDGVKSLVGVASIERYSAQRPRARINQQRARATNKPSIGLT